MWVDVGVPSRLVEMFCCYKDWSVGSLNGLLLGRRIVSWDSECLI